jgi:hypothetical protein
MSGDGPQTGDPQGTRQPAKPPACPICGKPRDPDYRPFCSKRCADVDLGRWLTGRYAIPVMEDEDEDGANAGSQGGETEDGKPRGAR